MRDYSTYKWQDSLLLFHTRFCCYQRPFTCPDTAVVGQYAVQLQKDNNLDNAIESGVYLNL